jgi:hypothetical protein
MSQDSMYIPSIPLENDLVSSKPKNLTQKRNKRNYIQVDTDKRKELLEVIQEEKMTIKAAAEKLKINYSTAKNFVKLYRKYGRIQKLPKKNYYNLNSQHGVCEKMNLEEEDVHKMKMKRVGDDESPSHIQDTFSEFLGQKKSRLETTDTTRKSSFWNSNDCIPSITVPKSEDSTMPAPLNLPPLRNLQSSLPSLHTNPHSTDPELTPIPVLPLNSPHRLCSLQSLFTPPSPNAHSMAKTNSSTSNTSNISNTAFLAWNSPTSEQHLPPSFSPSPSPQRQFSPPHSFTPLLRNRSRGVSEEIFQTRRSRIFSNDSQFNHNLLRKNSDLSLFNLSVYSPQIITR